MLAGRGETGGRAIAGWGVEAIGGLTGWVGAESGVEGPGWLRADELKLCRLWIGAPAGCCFKSCISSQDPEACSG